MKCKIRYVMETMMVRGKMEDRFNKEKSLELKGVAIIFMFWLHLYGHDNLIQDGNYYTELLGGGNAVPAYAE